MTVHVEVSGKGSSRVGTVFCVGRNYAEHAREMGSGLPSEPLFFLKPASALLPGGGRVILPSWSDEIHHEVELVILLASELMDADEEEARRAVAGYGVGLDLTARDVQARAKDSGGPWAVAKGWPGSAPVSAFRPAGQVGDAEDLAIELSVNGTIRQKDRTSSMLWRVPRLLAAASRRFRLLPGDLVFTGTPSGVGPLVGGDRVVAEIEGVGRLEVTVEGLAEPLRGPAPQGVC